MVKKILVLPDGKEVSIADLEKIKSSAVEAWQKAEEKIQKAEAIRREAEDVVLGCNQRIRLLKMLSKTASL